MREPKTTSFLRQAVAGSSCVAALCIASSGLAQQAPPPLPPPPQPGTVPSTPPPPPPPPPQENKLSVMAWSRIGGAFQSPYDAEKLDKLTAHGELDIFAHGKITKEIGLFGSLIGTFGPTGQPGAPDAGEITGTVAIEDAIIQIEPDPLFNVWIGRMLVASDRSNFSGPWHISPWFYPGFFVPAWRVGSGTGVSPVPSPATIFPPAGPRQGPVGRNDGVTVWGQYMGGMVKYYLGLYNLQAANSTPLWSGRVSLSLLNPEPGYFNASTYYGEKDIVGLGVGAQVQGNGSAGALAPTTDYDEINFDVLAEKNFGTAGTGTFEAAFYKYFGDNEALDFSYFALVSWLTPDKIGPGKIQPLVRLQQAKPRSITVAGVSVSPDSATLLDIQAGYVIEGFKARFAIGYENENFGGGQKGNAVYFGAQVQR